MSVKKEVKATGGSENAVLADAMRSPRSCTPLSNGVSDSTPRKIIN
jgi:hypothetical protein